MDLYTAHKQLFPELDSLHQIRTQTWRWMSKIILSIKTDYSSFSTKEQSLKMRYYLDKKLGRSDGDVLMAELLPLPASRATEWLDVHKKYYDSRLECESDLLPQRCELLNELVIKYKPEYIYIYGKN